MNECGHVSDSKCDTDVTSKMSKRYKVFKQIAPRKVYHTVKSS